MLTDNQLVQIAKSVLEDKQEEFAVNVGYRRAQAGFPSKSLIYNITMHLEGATDEELYFPEYAVDSIDSYMPTNYGACRASHLGGGIMSGISCSGYGDEITAKYPEVGAILDIIADFCSNVLERVEEIYHNMESSDEGYADDFEEDVRDVYADELHKL